MKRSLIHSFRDALRGVAHVLRTHRNMRIHLLAALLVAGLGLWLGLTALEWAILALAICLVMAAELANTALELLADVASPDYHPLVGIAKDVSAAAVLLSAAGAVVVGILVLGPRLLDKLAR